MVNDAVDTTAAAILLRAVSNPARLRIVLCLLKGEKSVSELETELGLRQPNLSQHLAELRSVNLVATRREVKSVYYRLSSDVSRRFVSGLLQGLSGEIKEYAPLTETTTPRQRHIEAAMFPRVKANHLREPA